MQGSMIRWCARTLAVLLCVVVLAAPATAQSTISEQYELAVGREVAAQLISELGHVSDGEWVGFLSQIRDRLVPFSGRPNIPYRIIVLEMPQPNAFSTPGWIFVTTGLIRLGLDADGWTFVMAHEMAHTARRHVAAQIERVNAGAIFGTIIGIVTGSRAAVDFLRFMLDLAMLGFSRELETEADIEALRMMVEAGYDPAKAGQTLAWFNDATGRRQERTHWAGTHPGFADRVTAVNAAYSNFPARGLPLRVRHLRSRSQVGNLLLTGGRLVEQSDAWIVSMTLENAAEVGGTILAAQASLTSPDGELPVRFLRSTLPGEIPARSQISGTLVFEKRSSQWPTSLLVPVALPDARIDLRLDLTAGGPFVPTSPPSLPRPPAPP